MSTTRRAIETLLRPRAVAVIGAGEDPRTFNGAPLHNLRRYGYRGAVYAVNPRRAEVQGFKCYPSILDVPGEVDTAIITVPADATLPVLRQCAEKGIPSATLISSGFAEEAAGEEGQRRAKELTAFLRTSGMRVIGPNTAGLLNLLDGYVPRAALNHLDPEFVRPGPVALISQSGACSNIVFNRAQVNGVGIAFSVATGDQADLDVWDLCEYALDDDRVRVLMVVAETLGTVSRFEAIALRAAELEKPIVMLKLGQSNVGTRVVMTHSGSLAGDACVQKAAMRQLGIIEVADFDELWEVARLCEAWGPSRGGTERLGVFSFSGGEAALVADHCERYGIELPPTSEAFNRLVRETFGYAGAANPFDPTGEVIGRPEKIRVALRAFVDRNDFTTVLVASPVFRNELAARLLSEIEPAVEGAAPRVLFSFWSAGPMTETQRSRLAATGCPVIHNSARALRALALYNDHGRRRAVRPAVLPAVAPTTLEPTARYFEVRQALATAGIPMGQGGLARSAEEAAALAGRLGHPVVLKANVPSRVHKAERGLVMLGLGDPDGVRRGYAELAEAPDADGVVVEEMVAGEVQVMLGVHRDPDFGPVLVFGAGGSTVEFADDNALAIVRYLGDGAAAQVVTSTRVGRFLQRRAPALAAELAGLLCRTASWFAANPQLSGLDLNPLIVELRRGRVVCVDARVS